MDLGAALAEMEAHPAAAARAAGQDDPAPPAPERASLSEWQAWISEGRAAPTRRDANAAWLELIEATGRLARHLRGRWAGKSGTGAAAALGDALRAALTLAEEYGVNLGAALRKKEEINRGRTWTE